MDDSMERTISVRIPPGMEKYINLTIRHDYLLYKDNGMDKENISSWVRFLVNKRISEIVGVK